MQISVFNKTGMDVIGLSGLEIREDTGTGGNRYRSFPEYAGKLRYWWAGSIVVKLRTDCHAGISYGYGIRL